MKGVYLGDAFSSSSSICNGGSMVHKYSEDSLRFLIAFFSHKERCRQNATSHLGLNSQSCQGYFYKVPPLNEIMHVTNMPGMYGTQQDKS